MHNSTLRGRGRAVKLTWVSLSIGKYSAAAPAIVSERKKPSAARLATLLQRRRLATPLLLERLGRFANGLKPYSERIAAAVGFQVRNADSEGRTSRRGRNADLTRFARKRQI